MTGEEQDALAGELALGVLDGAERTDALRLVVADPGFAREVERWRERFALWFAGWPAVEPDPALEARIMAALPGAGGAANDGARGAARLWRAVAGVATAAAAALLAALLLQPERVAPPRPEPRVEAPAPAPLLAVLAPTPGTGGEPIAALVDRRTGAVALAAGLAVPAGRAAELWTIGADATPRSLGLLGTGATPRLAVPRQERARLAAGMTLAVSIEPVSGSPTGSPTGPVVATGALREV